MVHLHPSTICQKKQHLQQNTTIQSLWDTYGFKDAFNLGPVTILNANSASKNTMDCRDYIIFRVLYGDDQL